MAILAFQKPDKVVMLNSTEFQGLFEFRPLEPGYGITIGNSLRRILLSSLEGFAITSVRIMGVDHEFSTIKGVIEDVTEMILNLKQVRFKKQIESTFFEKVNVTVSGKEQFTAGDISKHTTSFQVLNPDLVICNMNTDVKIQLELTIDKGRGYVPAEENKSNNLPTGAIAIDSIYTPIRNVKYHVENFRVEQKTDYEKLVMEITSDGSIHPKEALKEAAEILIHHFMLFSDEKITLEHKIKTPTEEFDESSLHMRQLLKTKLVDMDLSVRALNCLKAADVETLGDLVSYNKSDLLKFRNFGKKSLTELEDLVRSKNLTFGMNLAKYKLEKE
ncbi:MAG: DNA-directed RNA polymerase subunit alpha [Bacteroidetes bacterium]|nr:DNA-directed RNA polymerase subunit alpha [Bacteroidota bacterium]MBL0051100.1 DNA-directed RNA polymerase subunit alpha [Bacteroidota bacterium]